MNSTILTVIAGLLVAQGAYTLTGSDAHAVAGYVGPIARAAADHQEATVATAEALGLSCAGPARAEWDAKKVELDSRIAELEAAATAE